MLTVEAACEKLRGLGQGAVMLDRQFEPGIALIVIDNAPRHNALSGKMMVEFHDIVLDLERSVSNSDADLVAIIVTGSPGRSFCAGLDLSFARDYLHEATASLAVNKVMNDALERFARLPYITVASVAGPALGGGTELLTAFDFICMASTAFIRFVQTRMGVSSPWGGARRLVNHIGRKQALRLLAGAPKINAVKARDIGLVDVVVQVEPLDNVYQQCLNATTAFLKNYVTDDKNERVAPAAVRAMKQLVIRADRDADLVFEEKLFASVAGSSKI